MTDEKVLLYIRRDWTPVRKPSRLRRDPVTAAVRAAVTRRDQGCVGPILGAPGPCADRWGRPLVLQGRYSPSALELDHVKDEPRMGKRAPSDAAHLVLICAFHHRDSGWATAHRPELRAYLRKVAS